MVRSPLESAIGSMPLTRYSSTSSTPSRQRRRRSSQRACRRQRCPARRRGPARVRRRASRSRGSSRAGTSGASQRIVFSSENRLRSSTLARLSVPTATCTPDCVEPLDRRIRRRRPTDCCAGRSPASRRSPPAAPAPRRRTARRGRRACCASMHAVAIEVTRPDRSPGLPSRRATRRSISSMPRHGAAAVLEQLDLLARFAEVHAHDRARAISLTASRIAPNSSSDVEYGACGASETRTPARRGRGPRARASTRPARRRAP